MWRVGVSPGNKGTCLAGRAQRWGDTGAQPRVRGGAQMFPVTAPAVSHQDPLSTPLGLRFQVPPRLWLPATPQIPSQESQLMTWLQASGPARPLPRPQAAAFSTCCHSARAKPEFAPLQGRGPPHLQEAAPALACPPGPGFGLQERPCSETRHGESPLRVTWETDRAGYGRAGHQSGPPPSGHTV